MNINDDGDGWWLVVGAEISGGSFAGAGIQGRDTDNNGRFGWSSRLDLQVQVYLHIFIICA